VTGVTGERRQALAPAPRSGAAPQSGPDVNAVGPGLDDVRLLAAQYRWFGGIAGVTIAAGWHLAFDLRGLISGWPQYRWPAVALAGWLLYTAIGAVHGIAVLRGLLSRRPWVGAAAAVAVSAGVALASPASALVTPTNWAWGSVGWLGVLVLWDRRLRDLAAFLAVNAAVTFAGMVARGVTDRRSMAIFLMVVVGSVTLQLGFGAGARLLTATGVQVARHADELTGTAVERARAEAAHDARLRLGRAVHADTLPLLRDLAAGADPADPGVRHRAAVGAARLRRLLLETRSGALPLTVELRSCADIAARTGAVVDLEAHGTVPPLDESVRRALTEPALAALAATRRRARVTVTAVDGEVVVSVISDAPDVDVPARGGPGSVGLPDTVTVNRYPVEEGTWIETRWTRT